MNSKARQLGNLIFIYKPFLLGVHEWNILLNLNVNIKKVNQWISLC